MDRISLIRAKLQLAFRPAELEVLDESHLHVGHPGTRDGKGHFAVTIRATAFADKTKLEQHQMIYKALAEVMENEVHALRIKII